ncbi:MAG: hypothetical protein ACO1RT_20930 [Planctomycetaceae bacterium]
MIRSWLTGLLGSWALVWIAGPWLVNSILVRSVNPELGAITLREGDLIRWRSEGWASTRVGAHGLPGWKPNDAQMRLVIWGDSQVEGFCVNDDDKIHGQIVQFTKAKFGRSLDCLPIGRSGSDAADWNRLLDNAEKRWHPAVHVWIVTELSDLLALAEVASTTLAADRWQSPSPTWVVWAKRLHAEAAFQAARNLLLDPTTGGLRSLRFSPGRVPDRSVDGEPRPAGDEDSQRSLPLVRSRLAQTSRSLNGRLLLVYAPAVPRIMAGKVVAEHPDDPLWDTLESELTADAIAVVDLRQRFIEHWSEQGRFTRGFHNGTPSYGHLNPVGNRLIAEAIGEYLFQSGKLSSAAAP